jgi:toxin-antitoxin system PIN domain toxin
VKLVDANVLLYAVNESADRHDEARSWLDDALTDREAIGFSWLVLLAFLRLSTRVELFPAPLAVDASTATISSWLSAPASVVVEPTARHAASLSALLGSVGTGGNLVNDAHLAVLAAEHHATIVTYDNDFGRFPGVRWAKPSMR